MELVNVRKLVHMVAEAIAVFIITPYILWLSRKVEAPHKQLLVLFAVATLVVDGLLLAAFLMEKDNGLIK
jgi:hypothetical protein